jgi:5-methylcytosine-specific restriction protein A|nr:MAG TPA: HNH endonuclease [Caudoviricetes sp.]
MPIQPKKPCRHPGCANLTHGRYCDEHIKLHMKTDRLSAHRRGYDRAWRVASKQFLIAHPLCVMCEQNGILRPATVVDHIVPHKGDKDLFWDMSNWQALCKECHDRKTATEDGGFGRHNITY